MEKPRIKFTALASLIYRYMEAMESVRPVGESSKNALRQLARFPIALKPARELAKGDWIAHSQQRKADGVLPATAEKEFVHASVVLKYAGSAWDDCEGIGAQSIEAAKPFCSKHGLIGKSTPRDRRPQPDEIQRLIAYYSRPVKRGRRRNQIDMVLMTRWQLASSRRVGESCRITWSDWNREAKTILVRHMKDPRTRNKHKVCALPFDAQAMLEELFAVRQPVDLTERIFPYVTKSVCAAYTRAKKELGIVNLHLHDSRRDRATRLVQDERFTPAEACAFTGHETPQTFERTYLRMDPAKVAAMTPRLSAV